MAQRVADRMHDILKEPEKTYNVVLTHRDLSDLATALLDAEDAVAAVFGGDFRTRLDRYFPAGAQAVEYDENGDVLSEGMTEEEESYLTQQQNEAQMQRYGELFKRFYELDNATRNDSFGGQVYQAMTHSTACPGCGEAFVPSDDYLCEVCRTD